MRLAYGWLFYFKIMQTQQEEIWKEIPQCKGYYWVSNLGNVKSIDRIIEREYHGNVFMKGKNLKPMINRKGYGLVDLKTINGRKCVVIHRLVALAFIPNPENKPQVNHINGIKTDNRVENLEWCTNSENQIHAYKNNLSRPRRGIENGSSKLTNELVLYIRSEKCKNKKLKEISKELNISTTTISDIKNNKIWKHI
jgi:hypothetical protein